jgi:hypothetical protein
VDVAALTILPSSAAVRLMGRKQRIGSSKRSVPSISIGAFIDRNRINRCPIELIMVPLLCSTSKFMRQRRFPDKQDSMDENGSIWVLAGSRKRRLRKQLAIWV